MGFQWLQMRISEEKDRRERDALVRDRLPRALEELASDLGACVDAYRQAFGDDAAIELGDSRIRVTTPDGGAVTVAPAPELPGFRVERGGESFAIQVGLLPGDKLFYKDEEKFLTLDEVTRRILDRALFPKLDG